MNSMTTLYRTFQAAAIVPLLAVAPSFAQSDCTGYHKFNCERSGDTRFSPNGQSRSAPVKVGEETELNVIVYRSQDYRISVCHDEKILGESLAIRIVEKVRARKPGGDPAKPEYEETEKVLWDNTEHEMAQEVEFSCTATKRIAVEVNAPGPAERKGRAADQDIGCVGILIEHMPTPGLGF